MGSSLFEQNLSGSAFRRGLPLPREIRLTGIILSGSLSLFLSRWVKNRPVNCHNRLTSAEDYEEALLSGYPPVGLLDAKNVYHSEQKGNRLTRPERRGLRSPWGQRAARIWHLTCKLRWRLGLPRWREASCPGKAGAVRKDEGDEMKRSWTAWAVALAAIFAVAGCNDYGNTFQNNTGASISFLSPAQISAGGADFVITVNGGGFVTKTVVEWNGKPLKTAPTLDSGGNILNETATVPASFIANPGLPT